ncbi:MAG: CoA pyrophosphatase, partial [Bacteroidia bacterium]
MIIIEELAVNLGNAIDNGLPGAEIQWKMASSDRRTKTYPRQRREDSRLSAVLILLYPVNDTPTTVFIQRPLYDGVHSGQIGFPGGKMEEGDNTLTGTALREACEETGICSDDVFVIGSLTP